MNGSSRQKYTHVSQLITSNPQMPQLGQKQQKMINDDDKEMKKKDERKEKNVGEE